MTYARGTLARGAPMRANCCPAPARQPVRASLVAEVTTLPVVEVSCLR